MKQWFIFVFLCVFQLCFSQKQLIALFSEEQNYFLEDVTNLNYSFTKTFSCNEEKLLELKKDALRTVNNTKSIDQLDHFYTFSYYDDALLSWLENNSISYFFHNNFIVAPPGDIAPATPNYVSQQSYLLSNPGLNVEAVWNLGYNGQNITIHNVEYGFNKNHEEFHVFNCDIAPGMTVNSSASTSYTEHGTATMGVLFGNNGSYGITGIAHGAQQVWLYPEWQQSGYSRTNAITQALNNSSIGDVIVFEMQAYGFNGTVSNPRFVPAEFDFLVWNLTKALTDSGRIVVAAAGNGYQNLDSSDYQTYMNYGDSGAIIVGGGTANTTHAIYPPYVVSGITYSSTYGARVDVQGWFENVRTTGAIPNSGFTLVGSDFNQSYMTFTGTSSATAQLGGVVTVLQSYYKSQTNSTLTSQQLRTILKNTGIPQGGDISKKIGPFPNMLAAINTIQQNLNANSFTNENIYVYPNPSKGIFNISLGNLKPETIEVYDVMGKLIMKKNAISVTNFQTSIDLSAVAQGIYFIKISANGQNSVKRIVKE
jgi:hypothetical protein